MLPRKIVSNLFLLERKVFFTVIPNSNLKVYVKEVNDNVYFAVYKPIGTKLYEPIILGEGDLKHKRCDYIYFGMEDDFTFNPRLKETAIALAYIDKQYDLR